MMEYKRYLGKVEYDDEQDIFWGEVLGIRDVVTFQGKSVRELRKAFRDSVDDYLEFCKERKEQPEKPLSGRFVVRIKPDLHRAIDRLARAAGKSLNAWVVEQLEDTANRNELRRTSAAGVQKRPRRANALKS